jgi:hypothetical protein
MRLRRHSDGARRGSNVGVATEHYRGGLCTNVEH